MDTGEGMGSDGRQRLGVDEKADRKVGRKREGSSQKRDRW